MVYRILTERGVIHRVRIYELDCSQPNFGSIKGIDKFDELEARESMMWAIKERDERHEGYEDFPLIGAFTISAISFSNDTITYSRNIDHYQYRILRRDTTSWTEV